MAAPTRHDPYKNFPFRVEIEGLTVSGFSEVSGLSATAEVIEYREGADEFTPRKLPGLVKYPNVTLRRGVTKSRELFDWWASVEKGAVQRRNVSVVLLDDARNEVVRWNLQDAWVTKFEFGDLNAEGNDVAIESIEIAHERLELA